MWWRYTSIVQIVSLLKDILSDSRCQIIKCHIIDDSSNSIGIDPITGKVYINCLKSCNFAGYEEIIKDTIYVTLFNCLVSFRSLLKVVTVPTEFNTITVPSEFDTIHDTESSKMRYHRIASDMASYNDYYCRLSSERVNKKYYEMAINNKTHKVDEIKVNIVTAKTKRMNRSHQKKNTNRNFIPKHQQRNQHPMRTYRM